MSGLLIAFDTATDALAIGLARRDGDALELIASADFVARRAALSNLLPAIRDLLDREGFVPRDVDSVVVGLGPGSFTGVRIGVASAKGLAHGLGVPVFGVSTLEAVAWRHVSASGLVGVVGDAMRGEVYPAIFHVAEGRVERRTPDRVTRPAAAAADFVSLGEPIMLAGDGLAKYRDVFESAMGERAVFAEEPLWAPTGAGLIAAFGAALGRGEEGDGDAGGLLPVYTRLSDAEENELLRPPTGAAPVPPSGVRGDAGGAS